MSDQMRENKGKPKLSYWYSTRAAGRLLPLGERGEARFAIYYVQKFLVGDVGVSTILDSVLALVDDPAVQYGQVCEFGESKYNRGNFRRGAPVTQYLDSALRHLTRLDAGEEIDPESGCPHAWHALWNVVQVYEIMTTDAATTRDDRLFLCGDMSGK